MARDEVLKVVTHTGDCYRFKSKHRLEPFNFYVSKIGAAGLEQEEGGGLPGDFISYAEIETVEAY